MVNTRSDWHDVDFRPAAAGWRVASIWGPDQLSIDPIAGWLIQERETTYGTNARRVVPAVHDVEGWGHEPVEVDLVYHGNVWRIFGPGQDDPTSDEVAAELRRRKTGD